jgi:hypothetical protein
LKRKEGMVRHELKRWSEEEQAAGEQQRQAWEEFFSAAETADETSEQPPLGGAEEPRIAEIQARHEAELLRYPNVVGVADGIRTKGGKPTGERCLVVYVERKIPRAELEKSEILPSDIEGIPVDVVEVGIVEAL